MSKVEGVAGVAVDARKRHVIVEAKEEESLDPKELVAVLKEAGLSARVVEPAPTTDR